MSWSRVRSAKSICHHHSRGRRGRLIQEPVKDVFIRNGSQEAQYYSTGKKFLIVYRIAAMSFPFASMVLYKIRALVKLYLKLNGIRIGVLIK